MIPDILCGGAPFLRRRPAVRLSYCARQRISGQLACTSWQSSNVIYVNASKGDPSSFGHDCFVWYTTGISLYVPIAEAEHQSIIQLERGNILHGIDHSPPNMTVVLRANKTFSTLISFGASVRNDAAVKTGARRCEGAFIMHTAPEHAFVGQRSENPSNFAATRSRPRSREDMPA